MSVTTKQRYWMGAAPAACDLCVQPIKGTFVDGVIKHGVGAGRWANLCLCCSRTVGMGIGQGIGQLYQVQADGRWLKTGG